MEFAAAALTSIASAASGAAATGATALTNTAAFSAAELAGSGTAAGFSAASAGTAASVGGSLLSALGSTSTISSILSGVATVGSILNTQRAADVQTQGYELNAQDATMAAAIEGNAETQNRISLKAALVKALSERDVATAASGVDLSFGTPNVARKQATQDAENAITVSDQTSKLKQSRLLERAASYRLMAANTQSGALAKEAGIGLTGLAGIVARG